METYFDVYTIKATEYLIAIGFLLAFTIFWRFITAKEPISVSVAKVARKIVPLVEGFLVPEPLYFHQGHSWVRVEDKEVVSVGMDDFAQKLVGKINSVNIPPIGSTVMQGGKGWSLRADSKSIDMLSPVDGEVLSVNQEVIDSPEKISSDPYDRGWLIKVKAPRLSANLKNLLSGNLAKKWIEGAMNTLRMRTDFDLGLLYEDGGLPVNGIAKSLDPEKWDEIAREFFLT